MLMANPHALSQQHLFKCLEWTRGSPWRWAAPGLWPQMCSDCEDPDVRTASAGRRGPSAGLHRRNTRFTETFVQIFSSSHESNWTLEPWRLKLHDGRLSSQPGNSLCMLVLSILALSSILRRETSWRFSSSRRVLTWWLTRSSSLLRRPFWWRTQNIRWNKHRSSFQLNNW